MIRYEKLFMQSFVNQIAIKLTVQPVAPFLWKLPLPRQSTRLQEWGFGSQDCTAWPCPEPPQSMDQECALATNWAKKSLSLESGFRSKKFLLNLSAPLNRGHVNTGTAGRGYFQPFEQGNWENKPVARDKNGEHVPEKRWKEEINGCFPHNVSYPTLPLP